MKEKLKQKSKEVRWFFRRKKRQHDMIMHNEFRSLKSAKPKEFWQILNKATCNKTIVNDIPLDDFFAHFFKLLNDPGCENNENFDVTKHSQCSNEEINKPFTIEEVKQQ